MASSIIPKALDGDISSLNDALANGLGGVKITVGQVGAHSTYTVTAANMWMIVASGSTNNAIFQCRSNSVVELMHSGTVMTCTASGTTYTITNDAGTAVRFLMITAEGYTPTN